jgi:hypothetical protein
MQDQQRQSRRAGKGEFRLAAGILCLGFLFCPFALRADEFSQTSQYKVRLFSFGTLTVDSRTGDLDIRAWDEPYVEVIAEKVVRASSEKQAQALYPRIQVRLDGQDKNVRLATVYPSRRPWRPFRGESKLTVNYQIRMPYDSNLVLKCVDGDVKIRGVAGRVDLRVNYGDVEIDVPSAEGLRLLDAHAWLGYVQTDLDGVQQDNAGLHRRLSFFNRQGKQDIVVRVHMGGLFVYNEQ